MIYYCTITGTIEKVVNINFHATVNYQFFEIFLAPAESARN